MGANNEPDPTLEVGTMFVEEEAIAVSELLAEVRRRNLRRASGRASLGDSSSAWT